MSEASWEDTHSHRNTPPLTPHHFQEEDANTELNVSTDFCGDFNVKTCEKKVCNLVHAWHIFIKGEATVISNSSARVPRGRSRSQKRAKHSGPPDWSRVPLQKFLSLHWNTVRMKKKKKGKGKCVSAGWRGKDDGRGGVTDVCGCLLFLALEGEAGSVLLQGRAQR